MSIIKIHYPIFSTRLNGSVNTIIIIHENSIDNDNFSSWANNVMDASEVIHNELVIVCTINNHNLKKIEDLIIDWITNDNF